MAPGLFGFNGGVQLHDLAAMRRLPAWGTILDAFQAGLLFRKVGFSGDQNVYNGVASLFPHLFHTLGCEWNRQLGSWCMADVAQPDVQQLLVDDAEVHACPNRCALLHFNAIKCGAQALRGAAGSCVAWHGLLQRLEEGDNSSACPDQQTLNQIRHRWRHPTALTTGLRRWFGDCCLR